MGTSNEFIYKSRSFKNVICQSSLATETMFAMPVKSRRPQLASRGRRLTEPNRLIYEPKTENSLRFGLHVLGINQGVEICGVYRSI